jgi:hypothetical protein
MSYRFETIKTGITFGTALAMEMSEEWMIRRYLIFEDEVSGKTTKELLAA